MTDIVEGPALAALSCGKPAYLVVLLHGPGGDGQAMIDHALNWAPTMPKAEFLAAEIPFASDPPFVDETLASALDGFLDEALAKRRLPDSHLALVGFSHGATLALHVGLRRAEIAAIVAFSSVVDDAEGLARAIRAKPPTLLIHGDADPVAPHAAMLAAKSALAAQGAPVKSFKRPGLGHEMDDDGVVAAGDFLTAHVVHKAAAHEDP